LDVTGIGKINSIAKVACENWSHYERTQFAKTLMDKIVGARHGLARLANTYESLDKPVSANSIRISGVLVLDMIIPPDRKRLEGIP
jgi:hypothetical protein